MPMIVEGAMFADTYEKASHFTFPVIIAIRHFDGTTQGLIATFVILNRDGWFVTAKHILSILAASQQHEKEIAIYNEKIEAIRKNDKLKPIIKQKSIKQVPSNPKWITKVTYFWSTGGRITDIYLEPNADLAIARFENYSEEKGGIYPILKGPFGFRHGTSLCTIGYPFYNIEPPIYREETDTFDFKEGTFPIPRFPVPGILTRLVQDPDRKISLIETSHPGLRGQSGGPILDTKGRIWGIQSETKHLDLGFTTTERQYLHVGWGTHVEVLIAMLQKYNIEVAISED